MKVAWFDPFSGGSGDMILGALIDAGCPVDALRAELRRIPLTGYRLEVERTAQHGIGGARVNVVVDDDAQTARDWRAIRSLLEIATLSGAIRERIVAIFARLAEAEAAIHGETLESVHFHEVGGVDAIVDIAGAVLGLELLGVERVFTAPPRLGAGWARSAHGQIPVPAPATAALLAEVGAPFTSEPPGEPAGELLTPTGAAILTTLATFGRPAMAPSAIGYGFGRRQLPWPNALRVWIGEAAEAAGDGEVLVQTNIDDMNPQFFEPLLERLFAAGALDAWLEPVIMKKGRPAVVVSAICPAGRRGAVEAALFANSTTLGVRVTAIERT
ncbi:MAG TPA: nickel pincer cofactor biosynthesis protein LarC, partial [Thermomicrobiales bacterium]|nr:nickel pincer cofactor biosynthesis protein LarC [Thermomicrobiales bacterium]